MTERMPLDGRAVRWRRRFILSASLNGAILLLLAVAVLLPALGRARLSARQLPVPIVITPGDGTVGVPLFTVRPTDGSEVTAAYLRRLFDAAREGPRHRGELDSLGVRFVVALAPWGQGWIEFGGSEDDRWRLHWVAVRSDGPSGPAEISLVPTVAEPVLRGEDDRRPMGRSQFQRNFPLAWLWIEEALRDAARTLRSQSQPSPGPNAPPT